MSHFLSVDGCEFSVSEVSTNNSTFSIMNRQSCGTRGGIDSTLEMVRPYINILSRNSCYLTNSNCAGESGKEKKEGRNGDYV